MNRNGKIKRVTITSIDDNHASVGIEFGIKGEYEDYICLVPYIKTDEFVLNLTEGSPRLFEDTNCDISINLTGDCLKVDNKNGEKCFYCVETMKERNI